MSLFWNPCRWLVMAHLVWFTKLASLTVKRWWLLRRSYKIRGSRSGYNILMSVLLRYKLKTRDIFSKLWRLCTSSRRTCWYLFMCFPVLQNRELQIMRKLDHCNIVRLRYFFYSSGEKVQPFLLWSTRTNMIKQYLWDHFHMVSNAVGFVEWRIHKHLRF